MSDLIVSLVLIAPWAFVAWVLLRIVLIHFFDSEPWFVPPSITAAWNWFSNEAKMRAALGLFVAGLVGLAVAVVMGGRV